MKASVMNICGMNGNWIWSAVCCGGLLAVQSALGQTLLVDEFDGTHGDALFHPGGIVDVTTYRVPFGGTSGDDFVGRTNFRFTLPADGVTTAASGSADGKVAVLTLDTYNPDAPGATFLGSDVITKQNFARGGGLRMTTRMRLDSGIPGGLVAAPFLYDVQRESPPGTLVRDEIDHEILTNNAQSAAPDNTLTNVWNDGNFASGGAPLMINNPAGFDVTEFHDYRTDWTPTSVKYYIDNTLVRTESSVVPDDPMRAHFNFWAPDNTFAAAYNAGLNPTATGPGTTYRMEIDRLQIDRFNTTVSGNLLADPGFEDALTPAANGTGGWTLFNNAFYANGGMDDGFSSLKTYGPFLGNTNASGAYQNVVAAPGEEFEASIWAYSASDDSILGNQNYTTLTLQFVNAAGAVIGSVNYSPGTNQKETAIMDGRDPNLVEDKWIQYSANAVAPAGTAFVRVNEFFIQLYHDGGGDGGAIFFDNASLMRLTPDVVSVAGDFNGDGIVDAADYTTWRNNLGAVNEAGINNNGDGGGVTESDYAYWKAHFGNTSGPGAGGVAAAVPEPVTLLLACAAMLGSAFVHRRRPTKCWDAQPICDP
jgi:Glycosyl hydrolases family 16